MNFYEHTIIARQDTSPSQLKQIQEKYTKIVQKFEGKVVKTENWGLMNLSYLIKKNKKGNYIHFKIEGNGKTIKELEKTEKIDKNLLRYLTVKFKKLDLETDFFKKNEEDSKKFSPGLKLLDVESIKETIPGVEKISPEILLETYIIKNGIRRSSKLVGVEPAYFEVANFELLDGEMFNQKQLELGMPVCIIGKGISSKFFPRENPIGQKIKVGNQWLEVIGVLKERYISEKAITNLGIRDYNMDVYTPIQTVLIRYVNRDLVTGSGLKKSFGGGISIFGGFRGMISISSSSNEDTKPTNYHQIDRLVVQVSESDKLNPTADVMARMLERRHFGVVDFESLLIHHWQIKYFQ